MRLIFRDEALKRLKKIGPSESRKIQKKIEYLKAHPLAGKPLKGIYEGKYSLKVWPIRILYTFDPDTQTVTIQTIDYRGDVYKR